jgi:hypothetical protein
MGIVWNQSCCRSGDEVPTLSLTLRHTLCAGSLISRPRRASTDSAPRPPPPPSLGSSPRGVALAYLFYIFAIDRHAHRKATGWTPIRR